MNTPTPSTFSRERSTRARTEGLIGPAAFGPGRPFDLWVRRGAGAYICGEETSLLNSLEGKHPFPRNRPPFPVTHGYENLPTVVNNVETLASIPHILVHGADWYRGLGIGEHAGTKVISLSGDIERPGNYEVPMGFPLMTLIDGGAGGVPGGRAIQAVTMAGLSGGFLAGEDLDVTLDEPSIRSKGSFLGAGGIMVFDDSRGHGGGRAFRDGVLRGGVVRQVLPLPHRHEAPHRTPARRGSVGCRRLDR